MTEYFRITGLHDINFDEAAASPPSRYRMVDNIPPTGLSKPLTRREVIVHMDRLPKGTRGHVLNRGMSIVTIHMNIQGTSDADMEDAEHDLIETLEDAALYIETQGTRGTQAVLRCKANLAVTNSYKTIYYGTLNEGSGRDVLGDVIKGHYLEKMVLTLYCEPYWRPASATALGPNEIYCPSFEEDFDLNGRADLWTALNVPVLAIETTIILHGCNSQKVTTNMVGEGIASATIVAPAAPANDAIAYPWVCRPAAGTDIRAVIRDTTAGVDRATADFSAATTTVTVGGYEWRRLELIATNNIVPANNHQLWVYSLSDTVTDWYVDKCFWKWDTTTIPDEWCDHWLIYNHYDAGALDGTRHENHINYFDMDDLKGDVDARIWARIEFEQKADENTTRHLIFGRRTKEPVGCWRWWHEGEDAVTQTNWADQALARCSAEECVSNAANMSGLISFNMMAAAGYDTLSQFGHYDVFAAVYTNDEVHTQYRLYYSALYGPVTFNRWVKQTAASKWQLINLGDLRLEPFLRSGISPEAFGFTVEYEKDAADTVKLDFIWLIPKNEPESRIEWWSTAGSVLLPGDSWGMTQDEDFDYVAMENVPSGSTWINLPALSGEYMTLRSRAENRLYFVCLSWDDPDDIYEAHGAATDLEMIVNLKYLPQYTTPLE